MAKDFDNLFMCFSSVWDSSVENSMFSWDVENTIKETDLSVTENSKYKKFMTQNTQKTGNTLKRSNLRIIEIEEIKDSQQQAHKYIQQNHKRKHSQTKERCANKYIRSF